MRMSENRIKLLSQFISVMLFLGCSNVLEAQDTISKKSINPDSLLNFSKSLLGTNYCYANCSPKTGFDCSGYVFYVFDHFGKQVPRSSKLYKPIKGIPNRDSAKIGDIIVFTGTNAKRRSPGHIGIVISNPGDTLIFIHCSSGKKKGVIISDFFESPYYEKRYLKIVRLADVE